MPQKIGYDSPVSKEAGFGSPLELAAQSRYRKESGFLHGTSYGGADGKAQALPVFAPRVPRPSNPSALPPNLEVGARQFRNGTPEVSMTKSLPALAIGDISVRQLDPVRGKPCRSGQGQERGRQSRPGGLDWF